MPEPAPKEEIEQEEKKEVPKETEKKPPEVVMPDLKAQKRKKIALIAGFVILVAIIIWVAVDRYYIKNNRDAAAIDKENGQPFVLKSVPQEEKKIASPINGEMVTESAANRHPLAVMIENHPDARPQSGLSKASAVYEAITEGGITRFMAVFGPNSASEVGPVRSARTFFVDWASEYTAYYAHAGGAPDALALIPKSPIYDLPHTNGYFERKDRGNVASEHTLFSSTDSLYKLASSRKYPESSGITPLSFKDDAKTEDRGTTAFIKIDFSAPSYLVNWTYNKENNVYLRSMAGEAHKDRITGEQIAAKVVIVQVVNRQPIALPGAKPSYKFTTTGSGKATVYQDGKATTGTWKKATQKDRTKFYDSSDKEITLDRGLLFYEIVPPEVVVTSS